MDHHGYADMSMYAMADAMRNRFLVAAVLSVPILLWSAIGRQVLHFTVPAPFGLRDDVLQLILSLPVIGTDVAIESADIVLMRSDPFDVVTAITIGRGTLQKERQNLCLGCRLQRDRDPDRRRHFRAQVPTRASARDRRALDVRI